MGHVLIGERTTASLGSRMKQFLLPSMANASLHVCIECTFTRIRREWVTRLDLNEITWTASGCHGEVQNMKRRANLKIVERKLASKGSENGLLGKGCWSYVRT